MPPVPRASNRRARIVPFDHTTSASSLAESPPSHREATAGVTSALTVVSVRSSAPHDEQFAGSSPLQ